mgnify:CR=1 FL=1
MLELDIIIIIIGFKKRGKVIRMKEPEKILEAKDICKAYGKKYGT